MSALPARSLSFETDGGGEQQKRDLLFSQFCDETDLQAILKLFNDICTEISLDPNGYEGFYEQFKAAFVTNWKAKDLFKLFDARAKQKEYCNQRACIEKRVLVIGAGPVGLRAAIEAAFLGAQVDLVEKRTTFNRNNLLHLWPFLITDLKNLGAKKYYGRFCSSSIDHIAIKILQSILLRTCLILGVKVHVGTTFDKLVEPANRNSSWTVKTTPSSCPVCSYGFDMIIGADGKQNSLPGFPTKEFRGKLALAITVNFVNSGSESETQADEISGVTSVYKQDFFNNLISQHGIDLENLVYYRGETHYFVMTAKKTSLLERKVIKKDCSDPRELLSKGNLDRKMLEQYARDASSYATKDHLKGLPFEKNHRGENDVALFDFTSLVKSENAARIVEKKGKSILLCLAGDSLLEPFWPTGTGCARGFLGVFDAAWLMKRFCAGHDPLEILDERESILYLLPQTKVENLHKNYNSYSIDPKSRYLNLSEAIEAEEIHHLYDTDNDGALQRSQNLRRSRSSKRRTRSSVSSVASSGSQHRPTTPKATVELLSIVELEASPSNRKRWQTKPSSLQEPRSPSQIELRSPSQAEPKSSSQSKPKSPSQIAPANLSSSKSSPSSNGKSKDKEEAGDKKKKEVSSPGPSRWSKFLSRFRRSRSSATPPAVGTPDNNTVERRKHPIRSRGSVSRSISLKEERKDQPKVEQPKVVQHRNSVLDFVKKYNDLDEEAGNIPAPSKDASKTPEKQDNKNKDKPKKKSKKKDRKGSRLEETDDAEPSRKCFCICC